MGGRSKGEDFFCKILEVGGSGLIGESTNGKPERWCETSWRVGRTTSSRACKEMVFYSKLEEIFEECVLWSETIKFALLKKLLSQRIKMGWCVVAVYRA